MSKARERGSSEDHSKQTELVQISGGLLTRAVLHS